jgi:hypothetical protein
MIESILVAMLSADLVAGGGMDSWVHAGQRDTIVSAYGHCPEYAEVFGMLGAQVSEAGADNLFVMETLCN